MQSRTNFLVLIAFVFVVSSVSLAGAEVPAVLSAQTVSAANVDEPNVPPFPYAAEITGNDVYIRSGPGRNYYPCGKLNKGDKVTVVGSKLVWSRIEPPRGSFSWISKQYIRIDANNPDFGVVTGDSVRVWAGSEHIKPIHSSSEQLTLSTDDKVRLMGEEIGDYYKISPPEGAYLWVLTGYTRPHTIPGDFTPPTFRLDTQPERTAVVPTILPLEAQLLEKYHALEKQIQAEGKKPMDQRNYANLKKSLAVIAANQQAGKAARYCSFALEQIKRCELALEVAKVVRLQDTQLQRTREKIDKARANRLADFQDLGKFTAVGQFLVSGIYGTEAQLKHYRIIDASGNIACYALPSGPAAQTSLDGFLGKKVGLTGIIEPHTQTAGALVRFTEIAQIE